MRTVLIVALLLFAGCAQDPAGPPLEDRGELPEDIEAPPPEDFGEEIEFDPPGTPAIRGRVLAAGLPVAGAKVWVETVDLREPVDNVAAYAENRTAHLTSTDRNGAFQIRLEGALYHITIEAAGFRMLRTEKIGAALDGVQEFNLQPKDIMVVAHRGASFYAPENTLASLWKARWLGADSVEVDVRLTADGHLVAFHDPWVNRTTNAIGMVRYATLDQLRQVDAGSWFDPSFEGTRVPTLEEMMDAAQEAHMHMVLDVKAPPDLREATWAQVLDVVAAAGAQDRVTFAVFREEGVQACAARKTMTCAWIRADSVGYRDLPAAAQSYGAQWLMVDQALVHEDLVNGARNLGIMTHAWTLNHPDEWRPVLALGIDGVLSDRMDYLVDDLSGIRVDAP